MLIALEGPDRAGKTTVFNRLRKLIPAHFVPTMHITPALLACMGDVERRQIELWDALYDSDKLYICDRSVFVSAPVYDRLYGRPVTRFAACWYDRTKVLYFDAPAEVLRERHAATGDKLFDASKYELVQGLYKAVLSRYACTVLNATRTVPEMTLAAVEAIVKWQNLG